MLLRIHSDASFLNRPNSGSTAGGFHFLGTTDPDFLNGPIFCHCTRIPVVCAAVSEAEYAGIFANCEIGSDERSILESLGYPQPPTTIYCDNLCSVGLASDTMRPKKSKSIDKRFDWIKCRVRQRQFNVEWISGESNLADIFTKNLPVHVHQQLAPIYVSPPPTPPQLFALSSSARLISDTGATHVLLRRSCMPHIRHLFSPKSLPCLSFDLPNGGSLQVRGSDGGSLSFPGKTDPVDCYICDDNLLAHNLVGTSPLLNPDGHAIYTPFSVQFFSPASDAPFLSGTKSPDSALWLLDFPPPPAASMSPA